MIVIEVTTPAVIDAVAVALAVVPNPTGFWIDTWGADVYPLPPVDIATDMTVDPPPTNEVAAAPSLSACDTIVTLFWKFVLTWLSVWGSKIGLKLST